MSCSRVWLFTARWSTITAPYGCRKRLRDRRDSSGLDALVAQLREAGGCAPCDRANPSAMRASIVGVAFLRRTSKRDAARSRRFGRRRLYRLHRRAAAGAWRGARAIAPSVRGCFRPQSRPRSQGDVIILRTHGIELKGLAFDPMLASYLLDATRPGHPLEGTSLEHLATRPDRKRICVGAA